MTWVGWVLTCVYLLMFSYQSTLKQLFQEFENGSDSNSQLASVTMRIMQALQTNLDGKSKQYKDMSLTHLFLMNNIHYMVRSVRRFVLQRKEPDTLLLLKFRSYMKGCLPFFCVCVDLKQRICWETIGFRDTGELCSNMQISIKGLLGLRCAVCYRSFFFYLPTAMDLFYFLIIQTS